MYSAAMSPPSLFASPPFQQIAGQEFPAMPIVRSGQSLSTQRSRISTAAYTFGWLQAFAELIEGKESLVAGARRVPNLQLLSIIFPSELVHCVRRPHVYRHRTVNQVSARSTTYCAPTMNDNARVVHRILLTNGDSAAIGSGGMGA